MRRKPIKHHTSRLVGSMRNANRLVEGLRLEIAERRKLGADYEHLRTRVAAARKALGGLVLREDFRALLLAEGIASIPAPLMHLIEVVGDDEAEA